MDIVFLTDVRTEIGEVEVVERGGGEIRRTRQQIGNTLVAIEEFTVIMGSKVAMLLSPCATEAWQQSGGVLHRWGCDRLLSVEINIKGQQYDFHSGYAPTGDVVGRRAFFEKADEVRHNSRPGAKQLWFGDWNSHAGRDAHTPSAASVVGSQGLTTPTQASGFQFPNQSCFAPGL